MGRGEEVEEINSTQYYLEMLPNYVRMYVLTVHYVDHLYISEKVACTHAECDIATNPTTGTVHTTANPVSQTHPSVGHFFVTN